MYTMAVATTKRSPGPAGRKEWTTSPLISSEDRPSLAGRRRETHQAVRSSDALPDFSRITTSTRGNSASAPAKD